MKNFLAGCVAATAVVLALMYSSRSHAPNRPSIDGAIESLQSAEREVVIDGCATVGALPEGYRRSWCRAAVRSGGPGTRREVLEDSRITATTRRWFVKSEGEDTPTCDSDASSRPPRDLCTSLTQTPLRNAIIRLVGSSGIEGSRIPLETPVATVTLIHAGAVDSLIAVEVDLSAGFGSYSGPLTRLLTDNGQGLSWLSAVDSTGGATEITLASTLKTAWRFEVERGVPTFFVVKCRPDFDHQASNEELQFIITYERIYRDRGVWRRVQRQVTGFWEDEGEFPSRELFPDF